jgi:hypothetical protein
MHSKGNKSLKRLQSVRRGRNKAESILPTKINPINITTSSDESENKEGVFVYLF